MTCPCAIGELLSGEPIHVFESQRTVFSFMDKSGERSGDICTRAATNGAVVVDVSGSTVYIRPQNDKAALKMADDICANTKLNVKRVQIAAPHKDLNGWTRVRASAADLLAAIANA
jgi:hypothetical protein